MKNLFMAGAALLIMFSSCSATSPQNKQFTLRGNFDGLDVANNIEVVYTPASKVSITVHASESSMSKFNMEVNKGTLCLSTLKSKGKCKGEKIKVVLSAPALSNYTARNNAEIDITGAVSVKDLNVTALNNGEITFAKTVNSNSAEITATNNGEIKLPQINAVNLTLTATNNAEIDCNADVTELKASATNNAEIDVRGTGVSVVYTATNNAEIDAAGFKAGSGSASAVNLATIEANVDNLNQTKSNMAKISNR